MKQIFVVATLLFCASSAWTQPDAPLGIAQNPPVADVMPEEEMPNEQSPEEIIAQLNHPAGKLDLSSPENTVRSFVWAVNNADVKTMRECVLNALPFEKLRIYERLLNVSHDNFLIKDFHAYPDGDEATVTLHLVELNSLRDGLRLALVERLHLQRKNDLWLILPDGRIVKNWDDAPITEDFLASQAKHLTDAEWITTLGKATAELICRSSLRPIVRGVAQFVQEKEGKYDLHADWQKQIAPYIKGKFHFSCPAEKDDKISYSFNSELENKMSDEILQPSRTILIYEGHNKEFEFRHENKTTNITFVRGRVKTFSRADLDVALKNGEVKWNP